MRPSLSFLALFVWPAALVGPSMAAAAAGGFFASAWLVERITRTRTIPTWAIVGAVFVGAIGVGCAACAIAGAAGVHPRPGNCVI